MIFDSLLSNIKFYTEHNNTVCLVFLFSINIEQIENREIYRVWIWQT